MACTRVSALFTFFFTCLIVHVSSAGLLPFPEPKSPVKSNKTCTVRAAGRGEDDVPQILKAFDECNHGGTIVFPEGEKYHIATRLNPVVYDLTIDWRGTWVFSDDLSYWRSHSYPIAFQNHRAGFALSGDRIHIDGHGTGGINGSGNTWYTAEAGDSKPGRPMPFVLWNVSEVKVEHCTCATLRGVATTRRLIRRVSLCEAIAAVGHQRHERHQYVVR